MKEKTEKQKAKSNHLLQEIKVDSIIVQNPNEVAQEFNKYFTSVGPNLAEKFLILKIYYNTSWHLMMKKRISWN